MIHYFLDEVSTQKNAAFLIRFKTLSVIKRQGDSRLSSIRHLVYNSFLIQENMVLALKKFIILWGQLWYINQWQAQVILGAIWVVCH